MEHLVSNLVMAEWRQGTQSGAWWRGGRRVRAEVEAGKRSRLGRLGRWLGTEMSAGKSE